MTEALGASAGSVKVPAIATRVISEVPTTRGHGISLFAKVDTLDRTGASNTWVGKRRKYRLPVTFFSLSKQSTTSALWPK